MAEVLDRLTAGEIAVVPTDTVYGLAAALDSTEGISRLYATKGRPRSQPCQVLLYSPTALSAALDGCSERVAEAARALLPGTVTCLVNDPERRFVAAAGDTPGSVGLRVPEVGEVLASVELPLVATSANRPRGSEPARMRDVPSDLRAAAATLDAGPLPGVASSVVDLRPVESGEPARLIRPGPNSDAVRAALGALAIELVGAD